MRHALHTVASMVPQSPFPIVIRLPEMTGGKANGRLGCRAANDDPGQTTCYAEAKRGSEAYHRSSMMRATNVGSPMLSRTMTAMVV
jgi:hypothetical protein